MILIEDELKRPFFIYFAVLFCVFTNFGLHWKTKKVINRKPKIFYCSFR